MKEKLITALFVLMASITTMAQSPSMYPPPVPKPVELTLFNIILYFVAPVLLIVYYYFYRRKKRKEREKQK